MIEVEAKLKIKNDDVRSKITSIAKFIEKENKIDDYYTLEKKGKYPRKSLRVRRLNGEYQVNFKEKLSYVKGVHAKNEVEFRVSDIEGFLQLIKNFGFRKWLTKEKTTELYLIKNNFHIELNNVKGLGWFVEVEYLCDKKDISLARKEVVDVIKQLGASEKDIVKQGYTKLLWDKD